MFFINLARFTASIVFVGILSSCATKTLNVYVGQTVADAMDSMGVPVTTYDMPDGTRAYVWQKTEVNTFGGVSLSSGTGNVGYSTGVVTPVFTQTDSCVYTMYATKIGELKSPTSWRIVGYKKPAPGCE